MAVEHMRLSSGIDMPILGLGTWKSKPGEVENAVKAAIDAGYRHLDCAWIYGNEQEVGAALKSKIDEGVVKREDLFITSKIWNTKHRFEDALTNIKQSLSNLGISYLDLSLIHWPTSMKHDGNCDKFPRDDQGNVQHTNVSYLETWKALEKAMDDGLVKAIGLSNFNSRQIGEIISNARIQPSVLQVEIHPYFTQEKLVHFCKERNIVVTAYSPLGSPDRPWAAPGEPLLLEDPKLIEIAKKYSKSPAQVIIRWLMQRGIAVIPKSVTPSRIIENFNVRDFKLTADDMNVVSGFNRNHRLVCPSITVNGVRQFRDRAAPNFPFNDEF
ncbi:hypothetical protein CAPTEDRAFT_162698 [Capitella teleta]|uniref:alcohol dehydrogenase (NADP(+)) n=1 Tax=Capitella teleta TaxID=283909 RepID=R7UJA8_CAPTE|nr:hypothetical protein CAPTEDRAFT_162698 [Capitella teleta]|eukprot:ELU06173.1 hypothetical protein CAPTEDRAFT_162698 [Capitella teleta]